MDIAELIREARTDPELLCKIDTAKLLESISLDTEFLGNETIDSISETVFKSVCELGLDRETVESHCKKLVGYRFVDELHILHKGKYVRWIRHDSPDKLARGAVMVDVEFGDFGANILCRSVTGGFFKYRFDKCHTYQKLTDEEQLILMLDNLGAKNGRRD